MRIAFDISPITSSENTQHQIRGVGSYVRNLKDSLSKRSELDFIFFNKQEGVPDDVDLVHFPYFEPFFLNLSSRKKTPTVVTVHDLIPLVFPSHFPVGIKGKVRWEIQKRSLAKVDHVITDSQCSKDDITKIVGITRDKVSVVYLAAADRYKPIEDEYKLKKILDKYKLPKKFVLYVGDVTWNKNLPRLIDAFSEIEIPLVMVGKALADSNFDKKNVWNKDLVEVLQKVKNLKNVNLLGFVEDDDLQIIYNLATVFVMPSLYEGFGLPILEAMQSGCPVVTTREGSISEVASDAAYYVDVDSKESIKDGILKVFSSSEIQSSLKEKGKLRAKEFSWDKTASETISVYKKVLL